MRLPLALLALLVPVTVAAGIPVAPTAVSQLSTATLEHHELLRIDRDFGKAEFEIVLDGWMDRQRPRHIEDVRFWWVNTDSGDRRKPFSDKLSKYVAFGFDRRPDGALAVRLSGDRKEFNFSVELDPRARPRVFTDVRTSEGTVVRHCRTSGGRLVARRFLGIPVGVKAMRVRCQADDGVEREGEVVYRTLERGDPYVE